MKDGYRVFVQPDTHCPNQDLKALQAVGHYIKDHRGSWDECVNLGDLADMPHMFTKLQKELQAIPWKQAQADFDSVDPHLDQWRPWFDRYTWIEGNHEARIDRWVAANNADPSEWRWVDKAAQYDAKWVPFWSSQHHTVHKIGKLTYCHGCYVNDGHAKSHVKAFDSNVVYGHTHDVLSATMFTMQEQYPRLAQSLGCLCKYRQPYHRGRPQPTKWQQAFGEVRYHKNGWFNLVVYPLTKGEFWVGDRQYTAAGSVRQSSNRGLKKR